MRRKIWVPKDLDELKDGLSSCVVKFLGSKKVVKARYFEVVNYIKVGTGG